MQNVPSAERHVASDCEHRPINIDRRRLAGGVSEHFCFGLKISQQFGLVWTDIGLCLTVIFI